jgi:transcriptional regulator with XRE-family HTH domain
MRATDHRDWLQADLIDFGQILRRCRRIGGLSQQQLADRSGVSQSVISRAERGKAPRLALERLLRLQAVLGAAFPIGVCPHDHRCVWSPPAPWATQTAAGPRVDTGGTGSRKSTHTDDYPPELRARIDALSALLGHAHRYRRIPDPSVTEPD